jgi:hypothetical protein
MICIYCGTDNPNQATFCESCGRQIERAANTPVPDMILPSEPLPGGSTDDGHPPVKLYEPPTGQSISQSVVPSASPRSDGAPQVQPFEAFGSDAFAPEQTPPPGSQNPSTPPPTPLIAPQTEPQGLLPPQPVSAVQQGRQRRRLPAGITALLIILAVLLIAGSGLIYYTTVYQPNLKHAQATATAVAHITTSTAQALATTQAQINATATAAAQATTEAVATQTALQAVYTQATSGKPTLNDPLSHADILSWDEIRDANATCAFKGGAYHSTVAVGFFNPCLAEATNFSNFAYQVEITIVSGHTGGIMFRADSTNFASYRFWISTDGTYVLDKFSQDSNGTVHVKVLVSGSASAVNTGNSQSNLIAVVARGNDLYLYVNKQYVDSTSDSTYRSGQIGVVTDSDTSGAEAVFRNAQVWKL